MRANLPRNFNQLTSDEFARIDLVEVLRVIRLCDPDFDCSEAMTFNPVTCWPETLWPLWKESVFGPIVAPALLGLLRHGRRGEVREMAEWDNRLNETLPAPLRATSRDAGRQLLHDFLPPAGDRVLRRLQGMQREGCLHTHFVTVFAARCAVFNIPAKQAVFGYLFKEWQAGAAGLVSVTHLPDMEGAFDYIRRSPESTKIINRRRYEVFG